jgi:hypothetical protein
MKPSLEPPDSLHFEAAEGWIGLGDYSSATEELDSITVANSTYPGVVQLRWRIFAEAQDWESCLEIATFLTAMNPKRLFGWIHRAKSLHQLGLTKEAKDLLISVVNDLQPNSTVPLHLTVYCCTLGQVEEALRWLEKAVAAAYNPEKLLQGSVSAKFVDERG